MKTINEYIKEKELVWQPSFSGEIAKDTLGYRGALIIEEGKALSSDRKLPPKIQARQVIMTGYEKIYFFAAELESFNDFTPFYEKYNQFFTADGLYILYVTDLEKEGSFEYKGINFTAYPLDESSVWNELLELAELEKGDMKKLSSEEKIETLVDELGDNFTKETQRTYDEMLQYVGESSKQLMGAV